MDKSISEYLDLYKAEIDKGDIQIAYKFLVKSVLALKAHFSRSLSGSYSVGNVSQAIWITPTFHFLTNACAPANCVLALF